MTPAPRQHDHGTGSCRSCGRLALCAGCKGKTLHRIGGEYVCEKGCSADKKIEETFKQEMRDALRKVH